MWMTSRARLGAVALLLAAATATTAADSPRINGWYQCAFSTETDLSFGSTLSETGLFECAEVEVPLCYDGVCESDKQINLFVKRQLALKPPQGKRKAMIMIQGGPGYASPVMESLMDSLLQRLDYSVDFYTFDHRGTGRSEYLMCNAAQAFTKGSPDGTALSVDELQSCFRDINFQYDGQAAGFSTTSAAMDVRTMIETFMADQDVFVLGYSYGTYLAQRILQLQIPQVKGYVFESVDVLSVKGDPIESANSHWNKDMEYPSRRLLQNCYDDDECIFEFNSRETVLEDVLAFYDQIDSEKDTNVCAQIIVDATQWELPSVGLRTWSFERVGDPADRILVLAALGHAQRCNPHDVSALRSIMMGYYRRFKAAPKALHMRSDNVPDPLDESNPLLYDVIVSSERWGQPAPTAEERGAFFVNGIFTADDTDQARLYCVYTGSQEQACQEFKKEKELPSGNETFYYKHDKYFDTPLRLPDHASALIFNGGLDFATPQEFGELLYDKLSSSGQGVMMVNFDYGVHCGGEAVFGSSGTPCHDAIIAGFIANNGDVEKVNTSCMTSLPSTVFHN